MSPLAVVNGTVQVSQPSLEICKLAASVEKPVAMSGTDNARNRKIILKQNGNGLANMRMCEK
jgi:hypothetical protein